MPDRFLVMGDNHGNVESLRRVRDTLVDDHIDYAVHVGDFTRAWRHDRGRGVEQLAESEPILEDIDALAEHGLVWVWGNQDYFGDLEYDLDVGVEIPDDDVISVGSHRFTNAPALVDDDVILVTHMEKWSLVDHFDGAAHFCGNTHIGRRFGRRLNSAFLHASDRNSDSGVDGGFFLVELADPLRVEMHSFGELDRNHCQRHGERGVQFIRRGQNCIYCQDETVLMREMASSAHYGLTTDTDRTTVPGTELLAYAVTLWDEPPRNFRSAFESYLEGIGDDKYAPLARTADGFVVADDSYSY